jgi:hypothetical protein
VVGSTRVRRVRITRWHRWPGTSRFAGSVAVKFANQYDQTDFIIIATNQPNYIIITILSAPINLTTLLLLSPSIYLYTFIFLSPLTAYWDVRCAQDLCEQTCVEPQIHREHRVRYVLLPKK